MIKSNENMAVAMSRQHFLSQLENFRENFHCFNKDENIESYQVSILIRRNTAFINLINKELQSLAEAGLISKWIKDNMGKHFNKIDETLYFDMEHYKALFYFFMFPLNSIALSTFAMEVLTGRQWYILRKLSLLKWSRILVDGQRHLFLRNQE